MINEAIKYENLIEMLEYNRKSDRGVTFINEEENDDFRSYDSIYNKALTILYNLQSIGVKRGQKLIFQIEKNEDFIILFWACILGGMIPVPVTIGINEEHRIKLLNIFNILNDPFIITDERIFQNLEAYLEKKDLNGVYEKVKEKTIFIENIRQQKGLGTIYTASNEDIAFVQFSSGSTGDPKGVILTHGNLLTNIKDIVYSAKITNEDSSFGWMPLTHDLGLIGFHISPIFAGINQYIMPTPLFITQPTKWLEKTNQYRISVLASPNFGYRHFLNLYNDQIYRNWDLSCVRLIINGAEPVSSSLNEEFHDKMLKWGLRREATFPVYGMAEACVAVSFSCPGDGLIPIPVDRNYLTIGSAIKELRTTEDKDALVFVDLGYPVPGCSVRICDDEGKVLGERTIGNIQICGKNVTQGYYNNPDAYSEVVTADRWLKTGDLGFMRNNRLIVTGRKKDIIFVNGQNYYPHDIERIVEEIEGMIPGRVASCGAYNKTSQKEEIIIFILHKGTVTKFSPIANKIIQTINKQIGLEVGAVIPIKKMPKTTSGKVQRYKLKELYEQGEYIGIQEDLQNCMNNGPKDITKNIEAPKDEIEKKILEILKSILCKEEISVVDNFFEIGGDSLKAAYAINKIYKEFGIALSLKDVFEDPTVRTMASYVKNEVGEECEIIEKIEAAPYYEVSSAQKRMFVLSQMIGNTTYNISQTIWINGKIDKEKFQHAFNELVRRNESLRTYFDIFDVMPVQKVSDEIEFKVGFLRAEEKELEDIITSFIKPFDLKRPPLFRVFLIETSEENHVLVMDMHHIISDGTSISILLEQLFDIYRDEQLEQLQVQYRDFAAWQNRRLKSKSIEKSELYWMNQFSEEIPTLNLPYDYPRPAYQSFEGDRIYFELDRETVGKMKYLAGNHNTSFFMLLLSAYYILLKKYSNQDDITVGIPVSGRVHPDTNDIIGMFVNTLPLRNYPEGNKKFSDFLKSVRDNTLEAYENQEYQFDTLIEKLNIKRNMNRSPLFDTMFVMQNMRTLELSNEDLQVGIYPIANRTAKFDLTFFVTEIDGKACFEVEYCTRLFKEDTAKRFGDYYINILMKILENPDIRISHINMLSQEEMEKFIYQYNETIIDYPMDKTIMELIERQVKKTPYNPALVFENKSISYQELFRKYSRFAKVLQDKGIGRNDIVAIAVDHSMEQIIAILAVLKAGGAYVPIDTSYPLERINYMLEDSGAKLLLTQTEYNDKWVFQNEIININDAGLYEGGPEILGNVSMPEDIAYVIYTSGSTGKPKGVMIKHKNLVNYVFWASKSYVRGERLNFPLYTSIAFDLTITSIYTPLITGNSIVIYSHSKDDIIINKVVQDENIGIVKATPAHLALLRNFDNSGSSVKRFIVGGEQLDTGLAKSIEESFGGNIEIYNEYGPTETTVGCMIYRFSKEKDTGANVPIGVPADNVQIYILDRDMNPVPENVHGEMYISGDGVAKGYLGRNELTEYRFVENPFIKGKRMYKTGDLAKWLKDGNIEFIGRIDCQVKIKGFRIELGEIENQLLNCAYVEQAVVIDREDSSGNKYLVAYLRMNEEVSNQKLREYLLKELPEYMIPSYFIQLDEIYLTINGKVDKKGLPEPKGIVYSEEEYIAPENEMEELFASIWAEVLGYPKVGVLDNYFSLGGDSIKAIQIVTRLNRAGIDASVKDLLTYQTIRQCSLNCDLSFNEKKYEQGIVEGNIGLTPIVKWFMELGLKNPNYYNQSVFLKCKESIDIAKLEKALKTIVQQHDGLRLNYNSDTGELFFNNSFLKDPFKVEIFDISTLTAQDQALEMERIGVLLKSGFDIEKKLLLKCGFINAGYNGQYILLTAHHMVVDGISWRIILEDLYNIYEALKSGCEINLPSKTASIKDWYDRLLIYSKDIDDMNNLEYWNKVERTEYKLPVGNNNPDYSYRSKDIIHSKISKESTNMILRESHNSYNIDTQDVLIIALLKSLNKLYGGEEIVIELESHGRSISDIDLSRTVGWFTAIYPVKLTVKNDILSNQIKSIKEQLRRIANSGTDYGILKYINKSIENKRNLRVPIRFNYLGQFGDEAENNLFSYVADKTGSDVCLSNEMNTFVEINCMVVKDILEFDIAFNKTEISEKNMKDFADNYVETLEFIIDHMSNKDQIYFTPSDFETAEINQEDLDMLFD